jgi:hypothetical protein
MAAKSFRHIAATRMKLLPVTIRLPTEDVSAARPTGRS